MPNIKPNNPIPLSSRDSSGSEKKAASSAEENLDKNIKKINTVKTLKNERQPLVPKLGKNKSDKIRVKAHQGSDKYDMFFRSIKAKLSEIANDIDKLKYVLDNLPKSTLNIKVENKALSLYLDDYHKPLINNLNFTDTMRFLSAIENRIYLLNINYDCTHIKQALASYLNIQDAYFLNAYESFNQYKNKTKEEYEINEGGMCYGIAGIVPNFFLNDSIDIVSIFEEYLDSRELINQSDEITKNYFFNTDIDNNKKAEIKHNYLKLKGLLDNVSYFFSVFKKDLLLKKYFPTQDFLKSLNSIHATKFNQSPFYSAQKVILLKHEMDFTDAFVKIKQLNTPVAIIVTSSNHTISISYHPKMGFYGTDHDELTYFNQPDQLNTFIINSFEDAENDSNAVELNFIMMKDRGNSPIHEFIPLDIYEQFNNSTLEQKIVYIHFALEFGHDQSLKIYIEIIAQSLVENKLTAEQATDLFASKIPDGTLWLALSFKNGHHETVQLFLEKVRDLLVDGKLTINQALLLLEAKNLGNYSGLTAALTEGHSETVKVYLDILHYLLVKQKLTPTLVTQLLDTLDSEDSSGLAIAIYDGHDKAVQEYVNGILNLLIKRKLTPEQVTSLLQIDLVSGTSALIFALQINKPKIVVKALNVIQKMLKDKSISLQQASRLLGNNNLEYEFCDGFLNHNFSKKNLSTFMSLMEANNDFSLTDFNHSLHKKMLTRANGKYT